MSTARAFFGAFHGGQEHTLGSCVSALKKPIVRPEPVNLKMILQSPLVLMSRPYAYVAYGPAGLWEKDKVGLLRPVSDSLPLKCKASILAKCASLFVLFGCGPVSLSQISLRMMTWECDEAGTAGRLACDWQHVKFVRIFFLTLRQSLPHQYYCLLFISWL